MNKILSLFLLIVLINLSLVFAYPSINFTGSTPANNTFQKVNSIFVNISSNDSSQHYSFVDFDRSLVGWWRFDKEMELSSMTAQVLVIMGLAQEFLALLMQPQENLGGHTALME